VCFIVRKTISELECAILIILFLPVQKNTGSWCTRKGNLQRALPLDILMVPSPKFSFVANGNNPIGVGLAPGSTIQFGSLGFTADHLGRLSLSHQERDSSVIFVGMVHNGSRSLHTTLKESTDEDGSTSGIGGSSGFLGPRGCNVVTLTDPITATPVPENTLALQTILIVTVRTAASQPGMELLPDRQQAY
jgi:hypothetical protein